MITDATSILPVLVFDSEHTWEDLQTLAEPHLDNDGLSRLKRALEKTAETVFIERHYIDKDYRDTFSSYHSKKFHTADARCIRLHFFNCNVTKKILSTPDNAKTKGYLDHSDGYLGYSVIRPTRPNSIGRTLLQPQSRPEVAGWLSLCTETVTVQGTILKVTGFPFISQDGDATVCAHATLWMLMRYFSNRYSIYPEIYPVQIGNLTRDYSVGRMLPAPGLYMWQMAEALRLEKFASMIYSKREFKDSFEHLMYTYIESGIPIIASFKTHVVVLFGHQSNYNITNPYDSDSPFVFSSSFCHALVGNDDNGVPYQLLRMSSDKLTENGCELMRGSQSQHSMSDIQDFVVPLPEKVFLTAENARKLITTILNDKIFGYAKHSNKLLKEKSIILRLFLTTGKSLKKEIHNRKQMGHKKVSKAYRELPLPHFIWVCELSLPDLYPENVLGEVIWDATRNPYEPNGFLAVHYPEKLIVDWGSALNHAPSFREFELDNSTEYPIFEHNLKEILQ